MEHGLPFDSAALDVTMAAPTLTHIEIRPSRLAGCVVVASCANTRTIITYTVPANAIEAHAVVQEARRNGLPVTRRDA